MRAERFTNAQTLSKLQSGRPFRAFWQDKPAFAVQIRDRSSGSGTVQIEESERELEAANLSMGQKEPGDADSHGYEGNEHQDVHGTESGLVLIVDRRDGRVDPSAFARPCLKRRALHSVCDCSRLHASPGRGSYSQIDELSYAQREPPFCALKQSKPLTWSQVEN